MEVIAITDKVSRKPRKPSKNEAVVGAAKAGRSIGAASPKAPAAEQRELEFEIGEVERAIYAKLVQKVGNRHHWEDWAKDIAQDRAHAHRSHPGHPREPGEHAGARGVRGLCR
jgi:predicted helicase